MKHLRLVFLITLLLAAPETQAQQKFLMGYSSFSANQTPIWVAKEEGFFKRFGTEPDLILIEGGTRGAQALISGDIPIMGMAGQPVISARARGADLTMIAGTVNKMNYVLIGAPSMTAGSRITSTNLTSQRLQRRRHLHIAKPMCRRRKRLRPASREAGMPGQGGPIDARRRLMQARLLTKRSKNMRCV